MEEKTSRKGREAAEQPSVLDSIKQIASHNARAELNDEHQLLLFLQSWWSKTYNRPLKDPLLQNYTLEELMYEFYDRIERQKAADEFLEQEGDRIEDDKERAALDWAEQEERKELDALKNKAIKSSPPKDPAKDPDNVAWMEKQMATAKEVYGDTFGEDIEDSFE